MSQSSSISKSCISDQPISSALDDTLKNNRYAKGLVEFIKIADAPITIGIQGGWGSGKTSLINLLQGELERAGDSLCINVNAWQQSLFTSGASGEIALALLDSVYTGLKKGIEKSDEIDKELKNRILSPETGLQVVGRLLLGAGAFATKTMIRTAGFDPAEMNSKEPEGYRPSQIFNELRGNMAGAVQQLVQHGKFKRLVIFVDDLDRIHPNTAVEVLDVLKNIFDINHCISVLAVDYEVVIKGLRDKFGEKNTENEREFRQYFDKIIQIPFSMPTSAYENNIRPLLKSFFDTLRIDMEPRDQQELANIAWKSTDGVPRSIKRIVNTMSLLRIIQADPDSSDRTRSKDSTSDPQVADAADMALLKVQFIIVCIQINFPDLYQALLTDRDFPAWQVENMLKTWKIDKQSADMQISLYQDIAGNDWQQALLALSAKNQWLQDKAEDILTIMNTLKSILDSTDEGAILLQEALHAAGIADADSPQQQTRTSNKEDSVTHACRFIAQEIISHMQDKGIPVNELRSPHEQYAVRRHGEGGNRTLGHHTGDKAIILIEIYWDKETKSFCAYLTIEAPYRSATRFYRDLTGRIPHDPWHRGNAEEGAIYEFHFPEEITSELSESALRKITKTDEFSEITKLIAVATELYANYDRN